MYCLQIKSIFYIIMATFLLNSKPRKRTVICFNWLKWCTSWISQLFCFCFLPTAGLKTLLQGAGATVYKGTDEGTLYSQTWHANRPLIYEEYIAFSLSLPQVSSVLRSVIEPMMVTGIHNSIAMSVCCLEQETETNKWL